ncbi:MAG TPA: PTS fructose transporter subunit IIA [Caldimonas sp.]|jgi:PTS system ascorbate-specific IIA component|nr:PTS fructose transporter subunit IIA [Caldimonas sp.]HEX4234895.1 PTS fructose transporter subunit IIA [Caldimonas sp.]
MPGLMILAHAPLASALKAVAEHAFPDCAGQVKALDVLPAMPVEEAEALGRALLEQIAAPDVLIFTDVFGATPCNIAQRLADGVHVRVVTGVNVPMLWRTLCYPNESLESLVARALAGATQGVMQVATARPQLQTLRARGDGEGDRQDQ